MSYHFLNLSLHNCLYCVDFQKLDSIFTAFEFFSLRPIDKHGYLSAWIGCKHEKELGDDLFTYGLVVSCILFLFLQRLKLTCLFLQYKLNASDKELFPS